MNNRTTGRLKILLVGRSIAHLSYYVSIVRALCVDGHEVRLVFDEDWSKDSSLSLLENLVTTHPTLNYGWTVRCSGLFRGLIVGLREFRTYASYCRRSSQSEYYRLRWLRYLRRSCPGRWRWLLESLSLRQLAGSQVIKWLTDAAINIVPANRNIVEYLRQTKPDVLIISPMNMRFDESVDYGIAARSLGIPYAVPVISWDNLTTKGLFHHRPDAVLAWNETHRKEAVTIHGVPATRVVVTGAPFFDKWFDGKEAMRTDREVFLTRVGMTSGSRYVLYVGSSRHIARDESWLVKEVQRALQESDDPELKKLEVMVRPHPANWEFIGSLRSLGGVFSWPKDGAFPESRDTQADFCNAIIHAVAVVGINTTAMIDAVILDKPVIACMTQRYARTQGEAQHFRHLVESDVLEVATNAREVESKLKELAVGRDARGTNRRQFVEHFVRPYGLETAAGDVGAAAIRWLAERDRQNTDLEGYLEQRFGRGLRG